MASAPLPAGKLPLDLLSSLLDDFPNGGSDPRIIVGPRVGEDATVIQFGDTCLVAKTDPITFAADDIGHYVIHVNANDIATMGATPRWLLVTILLPDGKTTPELVREIFSSLHKAAGEIGISICGGHTEITIGLERPIVIGHMLGECSKDNLIKSSDLQTGDAILLTKGLGIEATALLAEKKASELRSKGIDEQTLKRASQFLHNPGISILKEANIATRRGRIHAMHDPTEGGVATALRELALASGVGLSLEETAFFAPKETQQICDALGIDPLGVISSGALLIGVAQTDADGVREAIQSAGIRCQVIGRAEDESFGMKIRRRNTWIDLPEYDRDEIARVFE